MALLPILVAPDPRLKLKAAPVARVDDTHRALMADMLETMYAAPGIGLAAPQVGVGLRLAVVHLMPDDKPSPLTLINPEVIAASNDLATREEGCLSLPGVGVEVDRPVHVRVRAQDEYGKRILIEASGLEARVIQHEMDHLDGVLILDRTSRDQRKRAMRTLREREEALA